MNVRGTLHILRLSPALLLIATVGCSDDGSRPPVLEGETTVLSSSGGDDGDRGGRDGCRHVVTLPTSEGAVWFASQSDFKAGTYRIEHSAGCMKWGVDDRFKLQNTATKFGIWVATESDDTTVKGPGTAKGHDTVEECEETSVGLEMSFTHLGGPIGMFLQDSNTDDNETPKRIQFRLYCP